MVIPAKSLLSALCVSSQLDTFCYVTVIAVFTGMASPACPLSEGNCSASIVNTSDIATLGLAGTELAWGSGSTLGRQETLFAVNLQ